MRTRPLFDAKTHSSTEWARTGEPPWAAAAANAFDVVESGLKADRYGAGTVRRRGRRFLSILEVNLLVLKERGGKKGLRDWRGWWLACRAVGWTTNDNAEMTTLEREKLRVWHLPGAVSLFISIPRLVVQSCYNMHAYRKAHLYINQPLMNTHFPLSLPPIPCLPLLVASPNV